MNSVITSALTLAALFSISSHALTLVELKLERDIEAKYMRETAEVPYHGSWVNSKTTTSTYMNGSHARTSTKDSSDVAGIDVGGYSRVELVEGEDGHFYIRQNSAVKDFVDGVQLDISGETLIQVEFTNGTTWEDYLLGKTVTLTATPEGEQSAAKYDADFTFGGFKAVWSPLNLVIPDAQLSDVKFTDGIHFKGNLHELEVRIASCTYTLTMTI